MDYLAGKKNDLKKLAKTVARKAMQKRYHRIHVNQAISILRNLEVNGSARLSGSDRILCDEYAVDVLGHIHYAPWLYVYSAISGGFKAGWIPDNYYGAIVVPEIQGSYGRASFLKGLNAALFHSDLFPDLAYYLNGIFFDREYQPISPEDIENILFTSANRVIYKVDSSSQGKGVHIITPNTFSQERVKRLGNGSFQTFIDQHPLLSKFASCSVATLRLTTVYQDNGEVSLRACYLRFGDGNDTHVQSLSHIRLPIDLKSGEFGELAYTPEWLPIASHPTSQLEFAGHHFPNFRDAVEKVRQLHKKVPFARCVGWDVSVDYNGEAKLMEWNASHNDIKFSEATQGPCFAGLGWLPATYAFRGRDSP